MAESLLCGYQGGVNKDKAYRKLLLRSAPFRTLTSAEIMRIADVKRVRISLNEMSVVKLREGAISRTSRREPTLTDVNRNRHNYDYYSHYRRQNPDITSNGPLPRILDPDRIDGASVVATGSGRCRSGEVPTPQRHLTATPRPTRSRVPFKRRSLCTPSGVPENYEIRGSSFRRPSTCPEGDNKRNHAELGHVAPTGRDVATIGNDDKNDVTARNSPPEKQDVQCDKMAADGKQPGKTERKRPRSLVPRLGTFAIRCSTTAIGYYGKQSETDRQPHVNSLSITLDTGSNTDRKSCRTGDNRCQSTSQGILGLTERNIVMLEKLRREEDNGELVGKKHVSSRVINWVKDRQRHVDLEAADDSAADDVRSSASTPAKGLSSAESGSQKNYCNKSTEMNTASK